MAVIVKEAPARTLPSKSKVYPSVINPYKLPTWLHLLLTRFVKRVTGHREVWGEFVDVKINAAN